MMLKVVFLSVLALASALQCPDGGMCSGDNTCCKIPGGGYSCCPLPSDIRSFPMIQAGSLNDISGTVCPDNSPCPSEYSCLLTPTGVYGCCPFPQGLSCADGKRCCPDGYKCSDDGSSCTRHTEVSVVGAVICPDQESECPDETTCCELPDGSWGCCPMVNAVCCDDKLHCCPEGTRCDTAHSKCLSHESETPMWGKLLARKRAAWENDKVPKVESVVCPDGKSQCQDGATCCLMQSGKYGCCPLPNAVCCTDHEHCCPAASTCDLEHDTCTSASGETQLLKKIPAVIRDVICPDMQTKCPSETTCCELPSGSYGCCPMPQAVCCDDHEHCCPEGTTCDLAAGTCDKGGFSVPWLEKVPALMSEPNEEKCDDQKSCPDGNTCCKLSTGEWACCPLPHAVCCNDEYCCPEGTTCDTAHSTCLSAEGETTMRKKFLAIRKNSNTKASDVQCDDTTACPDGSTCCKTATGSWACCPLVKAVCCDDHEHCCPEGTTCDLAAGTCDQGGFSVPWLEKVPALMSEPNEEKCDDQKSCPDGNTCCKLSTGEWACCPLPHAVCCNDEYCCPEGTTCDTAHSTCLSAEGETVMRKKFPAIGKNSNTKASDVQCDDTTACPDGSTCCKTATGSWACCPLVKAVCCEDHEHCCPEGTTCDLAAGTCDKGGFSVPWLEKVPALMSEPNEEKCDDQKSCPDGNTCCKLSTGEWACCPLPHAVCCNDEYCCPEGTTCDTAHSTCLSAEGETVMRKKFPAIGKNSNSGKMLMLVKGTVERVKCDDTKSCPDGNTCCKNKHGGWGCCSFPKAVCCDDHEHCCPEGTTCDLAAGTCDQGGFSVPWLEKVPALMSEPNEEKCDDQKSCPDGNTCCKLSTGEWACCPLPHAVCCNDEYCCPEGTTCDTAHSTCLSAEGETTMRKKFLAIRKNSNTKASDVQCDDTTACPDGSTCCKTATGSWACCPLVKAVCCEDHEHCCPEGTTCDLAAGTCDKGGFSVPWLEKVPALMSEPNEEKCDDQKSCPDGNTCCKLSTGEWACCPLPHAVCCNDEYCCPEGTTCDTAHSTCLSAEGETVMRKKFLAIRKNSNTKASDVQCDDTTACPDGSTCCKTATGSWACCPLVKAVCCEDHEHCCPEGTTCDLAAGTCDKGGFSVPWLEKVPALMSEPNEEKCDDQKSCPDGNTCCKLSTGEWACCPLPHAVCCNDEYCCPEGTTCDTAHSTCLSAEGETVMRKKFPAIRKNSNNGKMLVLVKGTVERVKCDDTKSCPDGNTCCKNKHGGWGCCSFPKAVCCDDHEHCCPEGTTCDLAAGTCDQGGFSVPWLEKVPALMSEPNEEKCDDQKSCPDGNTCCKLSTGEWACCPLPHAVCCNDEYCCPEGTTCDTAHSTCLSAEGETTMRKKFLAIRKNSNTKASDVQCDDTTACPDGSTCCKTATGSWACCPLVKAVCCEDHEHCCPEGTTCDLAAGTCDKGGFSVPWLEKVPALMSEPNEEKCDDQKSCPDGNTCCKLSTGEWACCPLPHAVCCNDEYCCPEGTTCDTAHSTCLSAEGETVMRKKFPAIGKNSNSGKMLMLVKGTVERVKCDDTKSCPDGNTCCKNKHGGWGCCSFPKAVCCDDHEHCCPEGTTCDLAAGTCDQGGFSVPWLEKVPALMSEPNEEKCDDQKSCPDGNTCCKLSTGEWACCPLPHAVCCNDEYCCPEGTTCDTAHSTCLSAEGETVMRKKFPAIRKNSNNGKMLVLVKGTVERVKCDDTKSCPDGNTCCKNKHGGWGCCSFPKAVCCDDHEHCCPEGTTCDLAAGTCDQGGFSVPWLEKVPALMSEPNEEKCDDQTSCPDGTTCCKLSTGDWACCPLMHAVCCNDHEHCCPKGYKCDVEQQTCVKQGLSIPWVAKKPPMKRLLSAAGAHTDKNMCDKHTCPKEMTCFKMRTEKWGCCPLPNAVFCNDQEHCCPQGYQCNIQTSTCERQSPVLPWVFQKAPLYSISAASPDSRGNEKCDDQHNCSGQQTCCKTTAGTWGCCPYSQGVCCDDRQHCCPNRYTCDKSGAKCVRSNGLSWDVLFSEKRRAFNTL
ncbi:multiple epidermal growth factor-like domains protein 6 isoform X6 [Polyodon spathula]|uniref:multiple epidermal growth factor-like domains protein 6 isoform X6 n=1 Tax=Polyodon spathula TaxID=7913 RepID=UPI001B7F0153|nr:multiple epidermal growth factor-like domains protein 6 isoform X6 [Polyodon spathula]